MPLTELHQGRVLPLVVASVVLLPHAGVVRLALLVRHPARRGGDGDDVEDDGEEQQQGHDPPAAGVGDPAAEHGELRSRRGSEENGTARAVWRGCLLVAV